MRAWRAYHPDGMAPGDTVLLGAGESSHIARVLRLNAGAAIRLFDGKGSEWEAELEIVEPSGVRARIGPLVTEAVEPETRLTLFQGVCRADRLEWILQKGTELGISTFHLVETSASEPLRLSPARRKRWERIIVEACKQSGRRRLPELTGPERLDEAAWGRSPSPELTLVLDPRAGGRAIPGLPGVSGTGSVGLLVGPESGLNTGEIDTLQQNGWQAVGLGPRILRTETAGLVAASLILAARGDLGR